MRAVPKLLVGATAVVMDFPGKRHDEADGAVEIEFERDRAVCIAVSCATTVGRAIGLKKSRRKRTWYWGTGFRLASW